MSKTGLSPTAPLVFLLTVPRRIFCCSFSLFWVSYVAFVLVHICSSTLLLLCLEKAYDCGISLESSHLS